VKEFKATVVEHPSLTSAQWCQQTGTPDRTFRKWKAKARKLEDGEPSGSNLKFTGGGKTKKKGLQVLARAWLHAKKHNPRLTKTAWCPSVGITVKQLDRALVDPRGAKLNSKQFRTPKKKVAKMRAWEKHLRDNPDASFNTWCKTNRVATRSMRRWQKQKPKLAALAASRSDGQRSRSRWYRKVLPRSVPAPVTMLTQSFTQASHPDAEEELFELYQSGLVDQLPMNRLWFKANMLIIVKKKYPDDDGKFKASQSWLSGTKHHCGFKHR
jgi:hypothetical protein